MRRYSKVNIHLADERLNEIRISGRFAIGDISGLLAQLSDEDGVFVDQAGPRWVVLRRQAGRRLN
jgi:ferric-dicitrate binding protein FerR (iron transport regulator)